MVETSYKGRAGDPATWREARTSIRRSDTLLYSPSLVLDLTVRMRVMREL